MAQRAALLNPPSLAAAFALAQKDAKNAKKIDEMKLAEDKKKMSKLKERMSKMKRPAE